MTAPAAALVAALVAAATTAHLAATTSSVRAQAAIDRGLFAYYAYNRSAAAAGFAQAVSADPRAAIAYWGEALAAGPDLNTPLTPENFEFAKAAIARAVAAEDSASPVERALIDAMSLRYRGDFAASAGDDAAYAAAMQRAAADFSDENVRLLAAEALLERDRTSSAALALVHGVLARDPASAMANHLCIHLADDAADRNDALPCAQRLDATAFPSIAEHLAHMPAHYWIETGNYTAALASADRAYALLERLGPGPQADQYARHDAGVGYSAAMMLGNYATATQWSQRMNEAFGEGFDALTALRFTRYDVAIRAAADQMGAGEVRGLAALHRGDAAAARTLESQARREAALSGNTAYLPQLFLARLAETEGTFDDARRWLDEARENQHANFEAEDIPLIPAEEALGGFFLRRGSAEQAAAEFEACLERYPNDPRALFGAAQAYDALGRTTDAANARTRFAAQWAGADTTLTAGDL